MPQLAHPRDRATSTSLLCSAVSVSTKHKKTRRQGLVRTFRNRGNQKQRHSRKQVDLRLILDSSRTREGYRGTHFAYSRHTAGRSAFFSSVLPHVKKQTQEHVHHQHALACSMHEGVCRPSLRNFMKRLFKKLTSCSRCTGGRG